MIGGNVTGRNVTEQEIQRLRKFLNERKAGPAGRGWWFSGAPSHKRIGAAALQNCWFLTSDDWYNFVVAMDLLMLGGGVGLSVEHRFSSKLARIKKGVEILHKPTKDADFIIPDSREGWCELAYRVYESFFVTGKSFTYSTVCVRGANEKIAGFGGTSSGPGPLVSFVQNLCSIFIAREGKFLQPIDCADLLCATGEMVVSGNVRRSAIIILGDPFDKQYLKAKRWDLGVLPSYRSCANFSVVCDDMDDLHPSFWKTYEHGEPFGLVNRSNIQLYGRMGEKRKDTAQGVNPCQPAYATVLKRSGISTMGQTEIGDEIWSGYEWTKVTNKQSTGVKSVHRYKTSAGEFIGTPNHRVVSRGKKIEVRYATSIDFVPGGTSEIISDTYVEDTEVFDITVDCEDHTYWTGGLLVSNCGEATLESYEPCNLAEIALPNLTGVDEFVEASRLMHRWSKRVTLEKYHHEETQKVVTRNRRVGTSITGCMGSELFDPAILDIAYAAIQDEDTSYSKELGVNESIRTTLNKPSGTMSKVWDMGGREGIHVPDDRYMIQRIRFSASDSLIPLLRSAGHYMEPEKKLDGRLDHGTLVVDFYQDCGDGPTVASGHDTWKQLDTLLMAQKHWADQAVSVTVYYKREEIPALKEWLAVNLKFLKSISFLCYNDHGFEQAPKETITKEQFENYSTKIKPIEMAAIQDGDLESQECASGACPVK